MIEFDGVLNKCNRLFVDAVQECAMAADNGEDVRVILIEPEGTLRNSLSIAS